MNALRVAILGAGPIGLEAALAGVLRGHEIQVFERDRVGGNVSRWGHVRLFSPWSLNRSAAGVLALTRSGHALGQGDACPTGHEYVRDYLQPLSRLPELAGRIQEGCSALQVGREHIGKAGLFGRERRRYPFRLLLRNAAGESAVLADVVLDCTGTYGHSGWIGSGGVPAVGEIALRERISYTLEDLEGAARERYSERRVLLVGAGYSAVTALDGLLRLTGCSVVWATRTDRELPYHVAADDPLPERARLARMGNHLASGADSRVRRLRGTVVLRIEPRAAAFRVALSTRGSVESVDVDCIVAHVGYGPERSLYRELQVHECYASLGPMQLAAALMADQGSDCLTRAVPGPEVLANPEPDFYIVGSKSYGRTSHFLLRNGFEQIGQVFDLIEADARSGGAGDLRS